jgi:hypothetical protein
MVNAGKNLWRMWRMYNVTSALRRNVGLSQDQGGERGDPMAVPDFQTLMLPVLRLAAAGEIRIAECAARIGTEFHLSEADVAELLPSGKQTRFKNRLNWAKSYLGQAGLIETTKRGYFRATQAGRDVLQSGVSKIDKSYLERFPSYLEFKARSGQSSEEELPVAAVAQLRWRQRHRKRGLTPPRLRLTANSGLNCFSRLPRLRPPSSRA